MPKHFNKIRELILGEGNKEIAKKGFTSLFSRAISYVISYAFFVYMTNSFNEDVVGLFQLSNSVLIIVSLFVCLGFQNSVVRFASSMIQKKHFSDCYNMIVSFTKLILPFALLISLFIFVFAEFISVNFFNKPEFSGSLKIVAIVLPVFAFYLLFVELLRAFSRFKLSEFFKYTLLWIGALAFCLLLNQFYENENIPFLSFSIAVLLSFLFMTPIIFKYLKDFKRKKGSSSEPLQLKGYLAKSYPMIFTSLAYILLIRIDYIMLGASEQILISEVGIYGIALKIGVIANFANVALQRIAAPRISALFWDDKMEELKDFINRVKKMNLIVSGTFALFIFIFAEQLLSLFGTEYVEGLMVLRVVSVAYFITSYFGLSGIFMNMTGNEKQFMYIMISTVILNIVLNMLLINNYGILGPAISTLICFLLWNLITTIYLFKKYKIKMYYLPTISSLK